MFEKCVGEIQNRGPFSNNCISIRFRCMKTEPEVKVAEERGSNVDVPISASDIFLRCTAGTPENRFLEGATYNIRGLHLPPSRSQLHISFVLEISASSAVPKVFAREANEEKRRKEKRGP